MTDRPMLHLLCGKAGAGKSTLAARLADAPQTLLLSQDHWTATLWPGELLTVADYIERAARLNAAMSPHLIDLLHAGLSLVLDWPANTVASRAWMRSLADQAHAGSTLHWLDLSDAAAWARCEARNATGDHPYRMTRAQFDEITSYFQPPTEAEGFETIVYRAAAPSPAHAGEGKASVAKQRLRVEKLNPAAAR